MISEIDGKIAIDYHKIHKDQPKDLSLLPRLHPRYRSCHSANAPKPGKGSRAFPRKETGTIRCRIIWRRL
jgi:hypothetical protein